MSGPQRSGTRIASKMIASDLGYNHIDESTFETHNWNLFKQQLKKNVVIHCPAMSQWLTAIPNETLLSVRIVFMIRNVNGIVASQERINWAFYNELLEKRKYNDTFKLTKFVYDLPIAVIKQIVWLNHQRGLIKNYTELNYTDLKSHSMYITKENRKEFKYNQTII